MPEGGSQAVHLGKHVRSREKSKQFHGIELYCESTKCCSSMNEGKKITGS